MFCTKVPKTNNFYNIIPPIDSTKLLLSVHPDKDIKT